MDLSTDGKPSIAKMAACDAGTDVLLGALPEAPAAEQAALALILGSRGHATAIPALVTQLARPDLPGRTAAWALGQMDCADPVLAAIDGGKLDARQHGYLALACLVARGGAPGDLVARLSARVEAEIALARQGRTCLGEQACRVLAMLGDAGCASCCDAVLDADPYTDKFELQRLHRAVTEGGRDNESLIHFAASWEEIFADDLAGAVTEIPTEPLTEAPLAGADRASDSDPDLDPDVDVDADADAGADLQGAIDWEAFLSSEQAAAMAPGLEKLILQLGPMLEQLAAQAVRIPLAQLHAEEFVAVMLQVLPQALPPQSLQVALSPQAINAYQALARYLVAQGQGDGLLQGVKLLREQLTETMRARGLLGGPDYSDPDAKTD